MTEDEDALARQESRHSFLEEMLNEIRQCQKLIETFPDLSNKELAHRMACTPAQAHRFRQILTRKPR